MKSFEVQQTDGMICLIFQWFTDNQRALPWRVNYTAYEVWISEMMLQQTQMERGVEYYLRWMQQFSSVEDVAHASESDILQAWEGLGYYSRARNLHAAAKIICEKYDGKIPCDANLLLELPGIGDYTVAAIMGISFEKDFPTVDANVERVFSRLCNIESNTLKVIVKEEVTKILPKGKARIFNQAWMEFGALICKKMPKCGQCPITIFCESHKLGVQNLRPIPKKKPEIISVYATFCIIQHADKGYLLHKRPPKGLWAGMWEFVGIDSFMLDSAEGDTKNCQTKTLGQKQNKNDLNELARFVLIKELENIFDINDFDKFLIHDANNLTNKTVNQQIAIKRGNNRNIFPPDACAFVKHSYTNHRLQGLFFKWDIDFDITLMEDYKWVKDINSVAMPAHHRKATKSCL